MFTTKVGCYVTPFNNFAFDVNYERTDKKDGSDITTDLNDGSVGLKTTMTADLWFEWTPYADRGLVPRRNRLSVALKMSNSAWYSWRGYKVWEESFNGASNAIDGYVEPQDVRTDQAYSMWFNTFIAEVQYGPWWIRAAGIEPEITLSQASIKSVFDNSITTRTGSNNADMRLPLFHTNANPWNGIGGIVSVIGQDLLKLDRREVEIYGMYSAGFGVENIKANVKVGSWKNGENNTENSWVFGTDINWKPAFQQTITFSALAAVNYEEITDANTSGTTGSSVSSVKDPMSDPTTLMNKPLAVGLGYEYSFNFKNGLVIKPYVGVDFMYEFENENYDYEIGGGLQFFPRGAGAQYKRNTNIGGTKIGDVDNAVGLIVGANVNKDGIINGIVSFNEDPTASLIPNLGGFLELELMNIGGKDYSAPGGTVYSDFMWAVMAQLEYKVNNLFMPYVFGRYIPSADYFAAYTCDFK